MDAKELGTIKRVSISQITPGMYVVDLDRPWLETDFLFHRRWIKNHEDIELLKRHGIREVVVDTARGADIEAPSASPFSNPATPPRDKVVPETRPHVSSATFEPLVKEIQAARPIHDEALTLAKGMFEGVGTGSPVNSPAAKKVVTDLLGSITRSPEANLLLIQMRRFQKDLFTHAVNICALSLVIGTIDGFANEVSALGLGALLHDVGSIRLPGNLLRKKYTYTDSERGLWERHPELGAALLKRSANIPELTQRIVIEHHERIDGSGYPFRLAGTQISSLSQIVAITDTYDAMLTGRDQPPLQPIEVLRQLYLQSNAGAFDGELIERVIHCLGVYPIGSLVELNTGERGIVIATNRTDALRPGVRLISSRRGLDLPHGPVISLAECDSGPAERRIVRALDPGKERVDLMSYLKVAPGHY
jgi:HD-GYP domain-containing protein (c-di-GMP phosphodiesterase class II)